jgi:hypothetical protein
MARYEGTVASPASREEVWRYLADLRSVSEWDPSVEDARLISGEPGTPSARYELVVSFLGRAVTLPYRVAVAEEPRRVVFVAETRLVSIRDEALVRSATGGGATATWKAELEPKGLLRLAGPVLGPAFARLGARAERGLADRLGERTLVAPAERSAA